MENHDVEGVDAGLSHTLSRVTLHSPPQINAAYDVFICASLAFQRRRSRESVTLAIYLSLSLCSILCQDDPRLPETLHNLANLYLERFSMTTQLADILAAVDVSQRTVDLGERSGQSPDVDALIDLHTSLLLLAAGMNQRDADLLRIDRTISVGDRLIRTLDPGHPDMAMYRGNLATSYRLRYHHSGDKHDLTAAMTQARAAADCPYKTSQAHFQAYHILGQLHLDVFQSTQKTADLEEALRARWIASTITHATDTVLARYPIETASILDLNASNLREFDDFDLMVDILQTALMLVSDSHPRVEEHACDLSQFLFLRYERSKHPVDLDVAIEVMQLSIAWHAPENTKLLTRQFMLCILFEERYCLFQLPQDLDNAIAACIKATSSKDAPLDQLEKLDHLVMMRYQLYDQIDDLEVVFLTLSRLVMATPEGDIKKAQYMMRSGLLFAELFPRVGRIELLNLSSGALQEAARRFSSDTHRVRRARCLNSLAGSYRSQYYAKGDPSLLKHAIDTQREVVSLIRTDSEPELSVGYASNLSSALILAGELGDNGDTIALLDAQVSEVEKIPDGHEEKPTLLLNLALAHSRLYSISGDVSHINTAISETQRCLDMMSFTHRDRYLVLMNAGSFRRRRFERDGNIADLDAAMEYLRESASRLHPKHPERAEHFVSLAQAHLTRHQYLGQVVDLDECVNLSRRALDISTQQVFKAALLQTLGTALLRRFERLHDMDDLHASVNANSDASSLLLDSHKEKPVVLSSLGAALGMRYNKSRTQTDLDGGINAIQAAVDLTPNGHPMKPLYLSHLGKFLGGLRFNVTGDSAHLEAGIAVEQEALSLVEHDHARRPLHLGDLSRYLEVRFSHTKDRSDADRAVSLLQEALSCTPEDGSNRLEWCFRLGRILRARFEACGNRADLELALQTLKSCFMSGTLSTDPMVQFEAAHACGLLLRRHYTVTESMQVFSRLIDLVPHVVWLGGKLSQRYTDVKRISNMTDNAVEAAIASGDGSTAIDWLDQSRCIVWSQVQSLRLPLDAVRAVKPVLADEIADVMQSLRILTTRANIGFATAGREMTYRDIAVEDEGLVHRTLAARYNELLTQARELPGLANFMQPERVSRRAWTEISCPVVLIHPAENHCEVFYILPVKQVQTTPNECHHLRLTTFTSKLAFALRRKLLEGLRAAGVSTRATVSYSSTRRDEFELVLETLWSRLVKPIIDELQKHYTLDRRTELPRITWCPSGPATFLPLHAAGIYDATQSEQPRAYNLFVSSYTPSLAALLVAHRRHRRRRCSDIDSRSVLAVAQPHTPGLNALPVTTREVDILQGLVPTLERLDDAAATRSAVLEAMKTHHWVHLACHGIQNGEDPTQSALRLHDGALELTDIMRASFPHAELAVLSACETATGDDTLPQEAVHLAAGMMMAGFVSVVATSWSIADEDGPALARELYTHLLEEDDGDVTQTAYALHYAMSHLREREGDKNFVRWVPFIHMGI